MTTGKTIALTRQTSVDKVIPLFFNMLSRLAITFLPRSKCLLISWLQSPSAVILEPPKIKSDTVSTISPSICYKVMGQNGMILVFWMLIFKPTFSLSSFTFIKRLFSSSLSVFCMFATYGLYYIKICSFYVYFLKSFYHKWVLNIVKSFICFYWDDRMIFVLQFVNIVYHIDWFEYTEESLHSLE